MPSRSHLNWQFNAFLHPGSSFSHLPVLTPSLILFVRLTAVLWGATRRGSRKGGRTDEIRGQGTQGERSFASAFLSVFASAFLSLLLSGPPFAFVCPNSLPHSST